MPADRDSRHPIGVVAERTGLTPDVLRVWERRYAVVDPDRSAGGQRLYSDADIDRLSLLRRATQGGHGIGHVASLSKAKLEDMVRNIESSAAAAPVRLISAAEPDFIVDQAIEYTASMDPSGLEALLRRSLTRFGLVTFIDAVASPFLRKVGEMWHARKLAISQEHLATAVLQRVVSEAAPAMATPDGNPAIVIATLEGERHANGALMAAAIAGSEGWRVIYLGTELPVSEIVDTSKLTRAQAIGISVVFTGNISRLSAALRELEEQITDNVTLLVGGAGATSLQHSTRRKRTVFLESMEELHAELTGFQR